MQEKQPCSCYELEDVDYDFDFFDKKEILMKMLENQTPKEVEKFKSDETKWDLWGDIDDLLILNIEEAFIITSTCIGRFIEDFLMFLPHLAYTDDKKLICPFDYESSISMFSTIPMENGKIRVSVFFENAMWEYDPEIKFKADIIIKKDTFLKQMRDILEQAAKVDKKERRYNWVKEIKYTIKQLDKYFETPEEFKKNYEPKRHIRVFDVAHKTPKNKWAFDVYLEGDKEANKMYWEKLKGEGRITDYDFLEQISEDIFVWNEDFSDLIKLSDEEIRKKLETEMGDRIERNWVYSESTKQWYSENEIMPAPEEKMFDLLYSGLSYEVSVDINDYPHSEDEQLEGYVESSYDFRGNLTEDNLGYLTCILTLKENKSKICDIIFDYRYNKQIRNALDKAEAGEYVRFDIGENKPKKMHLWQQFYLNSKGNEARDLTIAWYDINGKLMNNLTADKKSFISCFRNALDEIENKIEVMKHILDEGKRLKIDNYFKFGEEYNSTFEYTENFKGDYACVYQNSINGWGIINKNFEWVIKPEYQDVYGEEHPKYGLKLIKSVIKYKYLHNIDGKLFIASNNEGKQFVMDVNGDIKFPHVRDRIYYTYLNDKLFFAGVDYDKTYFFNSEGKEILTLDFPIGEKFWVFDDVIIVSKDGKYGIIDHKGRIIIDYIFSDITPEKDNLDLIPVNYLGMWGYVNKSGKFIYLNREESNS